MERKFFRKFTTEELFTEFIYTLMVNRKSFAVFPDNKQLLMEDEYDEWIKENGIMNKTERLIYHPIEKGYVVTHTESITNVTVPFELIDMGYEEFIKTTNED
jgi:hypothetical protein